MAEEKRKALASTHWKNTTATHFSLTLSHAFDVTTDVPTL